MPQFSRCGARLRSESRRKVRLDDVRHLQAVERRPICRMDCSATARSAFNSPARPFFSWRLDLLAAPSRDFVNELLQFYSSTPPATPADISCLDNFAPPLPMSLDSMLSSATPVSLNLSQHILGHASATMTLATPASRNISFRTTSPSDGSPSPPPRLSFGNAFFALLYFVRDTLSLRSAHSHDWTPCSHRHGL